MWTSCIISRGHWTGHRQCHYDKPSFSVHDGGEWWADNDAVMDRAPHNVSWMGTEPIWTKWRTVIISESGTHYSVFKAWRREGAFINELSFNTASCNENPLNRWKTSCGWLEWWGSGVPVIYLLYFPAEPEMRVVADGLQLVISTNISANRILRMEVAIRRYVWGENWHFPRETLWCTLELLSVISVPVNLLAEPDAIGDKDSTNPTIQRNINGNLTVVWPCIFLMK